MPTSSANASQAFHPALVRKLVTMHIEEDPEKGAGTLPSLTSEASELIGELLKRFVLEARSRATMEAEIEQEASVDDGNAIQVRSDHCTKIAAEMLMDYS